MILKNEWMQVEISELGAEVTRIFDREREEELLWEGDGKYWKRHSPVLFPNVGRLSGGNMRIGGTEYPASQHGFARDRMFSCVRADERSAVYLLVSDEESKKIYPFDFELQIGYELEERNLKVTWTVKNLSEDTMYFTIGGHPAYRFPKESGRKEDYCLYVPGKEKLTYFLIDTSTGTGMPEITYDLELEDGYLPLNEKLFEKDALVLDGGQIGEIWLCRLADHAPIAGMRCGGFPNFGIWSVKDAPFVCLEPWMGRCDDRGFDGEMSEKPGVNRVEPKEIFEASYRIELPQNRK